MALSSLQARRVHYVLQALLVSIISLMWFGLWPDHWVEALEETAWTLTAYMVVRMFIIHVQMPQAEIYTVPPELHIPRPIIDSGHMPNLSEWRKMVGGENAVWELMVTLRGKLLAAADEGSIHTLMDARLRNWRTFAHQRFAEVASEINTLAFEGIIGTLVGMMVFMAQASRLFDLPDLGGDAPAFAAALLKNLQEVDFLVVLTAFITSVIGWTMKAWGGRKIERRRGEELASIARVEAWLQSEVLAYVSVPSRFVVAHTLTLETWMELARAELMLRVVHVDGGLLLIPQLHQESIVYEQDEGDQGGRHGR